MLHSKYILCGLLALVASVSYSQHTGILAYFTAAEYNSNKVVLSWQIIAGSTCSGIQIEHSADGIVYNQIGEIVGVCGSVSEPVTYNFVDENPIKTGYNFYRLKLGNTGMSDVVSVQLVNLNKGVLIKPHPGNALTSIYFDNESGSDIVLKIYNLSGLLIGTFFTKDTFFAIDSTVYPNGLYLFVITGPGNKDIATGKMVIVN